MGADVFSRITKEKKPTLVKNGLDCPIMKIGALLSLLLCSILSAIPNSINGGIVSNNSPLNGIDITEPLIAAVSGGPLPGEWETEGSVPGTRSAYLLAHPEVFGQKALLVRGLWREEELEEIQITFNDAGSYFGYFSETIPGDLKGRARDELIKELFDEKQATFSELHAKSLALAKEQLALRAEKKRPKEIRFGKSRTIRAEVLSLIHI